MSLSIGIVGLPNVGKSTLFNALTRSKQANVQNYPFCTIEPNVGIVEVPDQRLEKLSQVSLSKKTIPAVIKFIDIAGLVKGASQGEGLGNKFLSHIREVDALAHVVRNFHDKNIQHTYNQINPKNDADIINLELIMADWQTVTKRIETTKKAVRNITDKENQKQLVFLEKLFNHLQKGKPARFLEYSEEEEKILKELCLLTAKPLLYVLNTDEQKPENNEYVEQNAEQIEICAKLEEELSNLNEKEAKEYLKEMNIEQTGLDKLIIAGYKLLNLITYFTSGEPETRAWTIKQGTKGPQAASVIHTDFEKQYIKAEVADFKDFIQYQGWSGVKQVGKMRTEGKEYIVKDGDIIFFKV